MDKAERQRGQRRCLPNRQGFHVFDGQWGENARLAWDTLAFKETCGIPSTFLHVMDHAMLEEVAGRRPGEYRHVPEETYRDFQLGCGACALDQWIARNPLTMTDKGFDSGTPHGASTGARRIMADDVLIDSPEAVVEHMERHLFPALQVQAKALVPTDDDPVEALIQAEVEVQRFFGMNMLKVPYNGFKMFPTFEYGRYGYEHYFSAYALYPELVERCFSLQADMAVKFNTIAARAIVEGALPPLVRLDHDMADSRGTLVAPVTLDELWFPHFARSIQPFIDSGVLMIWHCDGNLMEMVPRLLEAGLNGFQGFQYEDGMDYETICRMRDRNGNPLIIWAGVSVTRTLPRGTKQDVVDELKWLVDCGPKVGLFLGASSSVTPSTNWENVRTMIEGLQHYRVHGRA